MGYIGEELTPRMTRVVFLTGISFLQVSERRVIELSFIKQISAAESNKAAILSGSQGMSRMYESRLAVIL
jgi:hypothetical protein